MHNPEAVSDRIREAEIAFQNAERNFFAIQSAFAAEVLAIDAMNSPEEQRAAKVRLLTNFRVPYDTALNASRAAKIALDEARAVVIG
jgi:hypothetical protein